MKRSTGAMTLSRASRMRTDLKLKCLPLSDRLQSAETAKQRKRENERERERARRSTRPESSKLSADALWHSTQAIALDDRRLVVVYSVEWDAGFVDGERWEFAVCRKHKDCRKLAQFGKWSLVDMFNAYLERNHIWLQSKIYLFWKCVPQDVVLWQQQEYIVGHCMKNTIPQQTYQAHVNQTANINKHCIMTQRSTFICSLAACQTERESERGATTTDFSRIT